MHPAKTNLCVLCISIHSTYGIKANQPELLDEAFGMLRDQAENATVSV